MNSLETMAAMLRYRRPHRSKTERKFIQRFLTSLGNFKYDKYGNRYTRIGDAPIMYSCHTDSVHRDSGLQEIAVKGVEFKLHRKSKSNCLGADNAAGVWMMRELILAKKPGLYVFHRGEECGGLGSRFLVKNSPELVKDIKFAIAFDRRGTKSIITHQFGGRCCSDAFADSLAKELKLGHNKDQGGTFTDTAVYTDLVPECTNVSVGFQSEHSSRETLDMLYLNELRGAMIDMNWENLVIKRKAGEHEPRYYSGKYSGYSEYYGDIGDYGGYGASYYGRKYRKSNGIWEEWDDTTKAWVPEKKPKKGSYTYDKDTNELKYYGKKPAGFLVDMRPKDGVKRSEESLLPDGHELEEHERPGKQEVAQKDHLLILRMVARNPNIAAMLLEDYGVDASELADYVQLNGGEVPQEMYSGFED